MWELIDEILEANYDLDFLIDYKKNNVLSKNMEERIDSRIKTLKKKLRLIDKFKRDLDSINETLHTTEYIEVEEVDNRWVIKE